LIHVAIGMSEIGTDGPAHVIRQNCNLSAGLLPPSMIQAHDLVRVTSLASVV